MNPPKCSDEEYVNFVIAAPKQLTATEAARVQPESKHAPAHEAFSRLLEQLEPHAKTLWRQAAAKIDLTSSALVLDDSTHNKPYSSRNDLVYSPWSGKHHAFAIEWI
jgi:putative transposase